MGGDSSSTKGRESAIEALVDMDPRGPAFRVSRIMNEAPVSALASRPNRISNSAILESALSLSKYEIKDPYEEYVDFSSKTHHSQDFADKSDGEATPTTSEPPSIHRSLFHEATPSALNQVKTNQVRDRVMRHHVKIITAKKNSFNLRLIRDEDSTTDADKATPPSSGGAIGPEAVPPPNLVASLRKIYGSHSTDHLSSTKDEESVFPSCSLLLPAILRSVLSHSLFSSSNKVLSGCEESNTASSEERTDSITAYGTKPRDYDSSSNKNNDRSKENKYEGEIPTSKDGAVGMNLSVSRNIISATANIESIVGKAYFSYQPDANLDDNNESLQGFLIAALSVLTSCIVEGGHVDFEEKTRNGSVEISSCSNSGLSSVTNDCNLSPLQVGGALSLLSNTYQDSITDLLGESNLILKSGLLKYFLEASSIYEERIEVQKSRLMEQVRDRAKAEEVSTPDGITRSDTPIPALVDDNDGNSNANSSEKKFELRQSTESPPSLVPISASSVANQSSVSSDLQAPSSFVVDNTLTSTAETSTSAHQSQPVSQRFRLDSLDSSSSEDENEEEDDADDDDADDDDADDDDNDDVSDSTAGYDDDPHRVLIEAAGVDFDGDDDDDDDGDDDDSSSSSSSDEIDDPEDEELEEADEEKNDESRESNDGDRESNEDDEATMLQQALAMSLAEHEAATTAHSLDDSKDEEGKEANKNNTLKKDEGNVEASNVHEADENIEDSSQSISPTKLAKSMSAIHIGKNEDEMNLPKLPVPPIDNSICPMLDARTDINLSEKIIGDDKSITEGKLKTKCFDPASLSHFGTLPATSVLVHLLRSAITVVEKQIYNSAGRRINHKEKKQDESVSFSNVGVGAILFPPKEKHSTESNDKNYRERNELERVLQSISSDPDKLKLTGATCDNLSSNSTVIHLLVATLHLLANLRSDAIHELHDLINKRTDSSGSSLFKNDYKTERDMGNRNELSVDTEKEFLDETDDPAFAAIVAAPSTSSNVAHAPSTSEALEEKGMRRKAAAAAHVASLRRERMEEKSKSLHRKLELYSICSYLTMKCLRLFLQYLSAKRLDSLKLREQEGGSFEDLLENDLVTISPLTRVRLSTSLTTFTSSLTSRTCHSLLCTEKDSASQEKTLHDRQLLPIPLLLESASLWGECVPLIHTTQPEVEDQLLRLIRLCFSPVVDESEISHKSFDLSTSAVDEMANNFPWSDLNEHFLKLDAMCRRLRLRDMLEGFVSSPLIYDSKSVSDGVLANLGEKALPPGRPSSILSIIGKVVFKSSTKIKEGNLVKFFYALCHRSNTNLLLWDSLAFNCCDDSLDAEDVVSSRPGISSSWGGLDSNLRLVSNPSFDFDSSKCSDSIAILATSTSSTNGPSANQRASKVWGTALSSKYFNPKTGVHRWAVRLDKCERGHVFVGVATAQASTKTYVGGDKYGWGVIGTQALWHNRSKIRGDYGSTFRTGATVVVTLDTDAGTLSFGLWNDPNKFDNEGSSSTQTMSLSSPRRSMQSGFGGSFIEDWGIAFEGLPLDTRLFPAVGLYQRDDKVTLLSAVSKSGSRRQFDAIGSMFTEGLEVGECFYPPNLAETTSDVQEHVNLNAGHDLRRLQGMVERVQLWNRSLSTEGILYISRVLSYAIRLLSNNETSSIIDDAIFSRILPSIASSICLLPPSIPLLSGTIAMAILPLIIRCTSLLEGYIEKENFSMSPNGKMKCGKWVIRASPSSGNTGALLSSKSEQYEEYVVSLESTSIRKELGSGFHGKGIGTTGRSANGHVTIVGAVRGTSVQFVEEWTDGENASRNSLSSSSCVIDARLSLDGCRFEGMYRNVQYGTTGIIAGILDSDDSSYESNSEVYCISDLPSHDDVERSMEQKLDSQQRIVCLCSLLCMAVNHLSLTLTSGAPPKDIENQLKSFDVRWKDKTSQGVNRKNELIRFVSSSPALGGGLIDSNLSSIKLSINAVNELFATPHSSPDYDEVVSKWKLEITNSFVGSRMSTNCELDRIENLPQLEKVDAIVAPLAGGYGSLSALCPDVYQSTRRGIILALLYHHGLYKVAISSGEDPCDKVVQIWQYALQLIESIFRATLSRLKPGVNRRDECEKHCFLINSISDFLLQLNVIEPYNGEMIIASENIGNMYSFISSVDEITYIREVMNITTQRGILRYIGLAAMSKNLLLGVHTQSVIECTLSSLPRMIGRGEIMNSSSGGDTSDKQNSGNKYCGYYHNSLSGCSPVLQKGFKSLVKTIFFTIGSITSDLSKKFQDGSPENCMAPSVQSISLVLLLCFITPLQQYDYDVFIENTNLWKFIGTIFMHCRSILESNEKEVLLGGMKSSASMSPLLLESLSRHMSLNILRCSISVLHVLIFLRSQNQDFMDTPSDESNSTGEEFLFLIKKEIRYVLGRVIDKCSDDIKKGKLLIAEIERDKYFETVSSRDERRRKENDTFSSQKGDSRDIIDKNMGLRYLLEHGTSALYQKSISSGNSSGATEYLNSALISHEQHLIHLLNVLSTILHSPKYSHCVSSDLEWVKSLLDDICNTKGSQHSTEESCVPVRFRVRILRFMRLMLPYISPDKKMVTQILTFAGQGMAVLITSASPLSDSKTLRSSSEHDRYLESKEAVSLLRHLYDLCGNDMWRSTINSVMDFDNELIIDQVIINQVQSGTTAFLGGIPGRITVGTYVLLKPTAATTLSISSSGSNKSHVSSTSSSSSFSGTLPVVAGSGMEGIVAGLCRDEAMAGMVSHIDIGGGACEIILFDRNKENIDEDNDGAQSKGGHSSTNMTIRAVRGPLSDVVSADEKPIILDKETPISAIARTFCSVLTRVTNFLGIDSTNYDEGDIETESSDSESGTRGSLSDLSRILLSLRSATVMLSDRELALKYIGQESSTLSRKSLSQLLALASVSSVHEDLKYGNAACTESLSALPEHEARYWHLRGMISNLMVRMDALTSVSVNQLNSLQDKDMKSEDEDDTETQSKEKEGLATPKERETGYSTPPATSGAVSDTERSNMQTSDGRDHLETHRQESRQTASGTHQNSVGTATEDEEDNEEADEASRIAEETAAAHLREAAIVQMAELGLPRPWSEYALRQVGGTNIEAAVHFCLERSGDMERLLADEHERERRTSSSSSASTGVRRRNMSGGGTSGANHFLRQLIEMGFPPHWCAEALAATGNNVDEALTWILTNGERLTALDEGNDDDDDVDDEDEDDDSGDEDDEDSVHEEGSNEEEAHSSRDVLEISDESRDIECEGSVPMQAKSAKVDAKIKTDDKKSLKCNLSGWTKDVVCPIRSISGRSSIDSRTMEVSGLANGGFSSVGTKGVPLLTGKWYYETVLLTAGCLQIGWADASFSGHCQADRGDGCGDGPSSWAYDGWRRYRWHSSATEWGCRWQEGDVVGCLVDMDNMVVSFTLNGRGEEIGMGVAFSGDGFRPCGGVFACVSFNRKEKIRLILGEETDSFNYSPPPGYKGVGEAVIDRVKEMDTLLKEEEVLSKNTSTLHIKNNAKHESLSIVKPYLCDFSDGEHGHELFAWQHRYYGSDASVHLGAGGRTGTKSSSRNRRGYRATRNNGSGSSSYSSNEADLCSLSVSARLVKIWNEESKTDKVKETTSTCFEEINKHYDTVASSIISEFRDTHVALIIHYSRKLLLHLVMSLSSQFKLMYFCESAKNEDDAETARRFWNVLERCCSLHAAGWVGEAGAMAIASEAIGLGISSNENHLNSGSIPINAGIIQFGGVNNDDGENIFLPAGAISQFLSSVQKAEEQNIKLIAREPSQSLAACAEASFGGDNGGSIVFLQRALQSVLIHSDSLRKTLVATIRRSIRLLAVVEYGNDSAAGALAADGSISDDDDMDISGESCLKAASEDNQGKRMSPDARLVSFLTGLLLSQPVQDGMKESKEGKESLVSVASALLEAWSVGLLSASAPWRMICALTVSGILNLFPESLPRVCSRLPTLNMYFQRLESTVSRRLWVERAAVPVCSRYAQAFIELMSSVKKSCKAISLSGYLEASNLSSGHVSVDAATPIPLKACDIQDNNRASQDSEEVVQNSWEWDESWISSDAGWEVWTGTVECLAVDWTAPSRSALRSLMDGGDGPPMLREGCTVVRGLDWDEAGSGAITGKEDGKDMYEKEKDAKEKQKQEFEESNTDSKSITASKAEKDIESPEDRDLPVVEGMENSGDEKLDEKQVEENKNHVTDLKDKEINEVATSKKKKRKIPNPKLPVGTVIGIEAWKGIPGLARRVRWHLTEEEGVYRYGGDGGRFDVAHVEVNEKYTRIRKRHPLPESAEQCATRYGFGLARKYNILLRIRKNGKKILLEDGEKEWNNECILEWPDFGAGILSDCKFHEDGAISLTEKQLIFGCKDSGWEARFGQPSYVAGSMIVLSPTNMSTSCIETNSYNSFFSSYEELLGSSSYLVKNLRNRTDGGRLRVTSEMRLLRGKQRVKSLPILKMVPSSEPVPPPIHFDSDFHASSISLSRDGKTATCFTSEGRGTAFASVGFIKGVHYWEVKIEQADVGSIFIGVAEKPSTNSSSGGSSFGYDIQPRLNRWHGWGFVNFRATYHASAERVYGAHCHAGDTVGVLLDCDAGRISFFCDGVKYGEHILNDLGCAFENVSPFGFNADGCGSGGAGQGAPSGIEGGRGGRYPANGSVRPKALWPVVGLRHLGDRVTMSGKWMTCYGVDGTTWLRNALSVDEILCCYEKSESNPQKCTNVDCEEKLTLPFVKKLDKGSGNKFWNNEVLNIPKWFIHESFLEYKRWREGRWQRSSSRGSGPHSLASYGLDIDVDTSPFSCAMACASLGLKFVLLSGDRVAVKRSAGRLLELSEEASVLGVYQGRLWYRIVSQKSEGGSLTEGGGRAWFWDESEVVDGGLQVLRKSNHHDIELPLLERFKCNAKGGLRVVYDGGAVVRSDLEIFDGSANIGTVQNGTRIAKENVLERRVNSCGVIRYRIRYETVGEGWISSRIRGGKEEPIVEPVLRLESNDDNSDFVDKGTKSEVEIQVDEDYLTFTFPEDSARVWFESFEKITCMPHGQNEMWSIRDFDEFENLVHCGIIPGLNPKQSDSVLASVVGSIADFSPCGDAVHCSFNEVLSSILYAIKSNGLTNENDTEIIVPEGLTGANQIAATHFAKFQVQFPPAKSLLARIAMLRAFNRRAHYALPWLSVRPPQEGSAILGGLSGFGAAVERAGRSRNAQAMKLWVQTSSIGARIRSCRAIFFSSVKRALLDSIVDATTTPTPLSHDEYELPREVRTVRINRLRARRAISHGDSTSKKKYSIFSQLQNEIRGWSGAALRRGHVAKGHGGQKRAFKVKLVGEGVNDYSGPYREVFTDSMHELVELNAKGSSSLGVLDPSPNKSAGIGEDQSLFIFATGNKETKLTAPNGKYYNALSDEEVTIRNNFSSYIGTTNDETREVDESLLFLGRLSGTASRHGIPVDMPLPLGLVWKRLAEEDISTLELLSEIDIMSYRHAAQEKFDVERDISTVPLLASQQRMLNSFAEGMASALPIELFPIFTGTELRNILCGSPDVDVDLLQRVVEYEGYQENDGVILNFWETLREMTSNERKLFLQFVWARSRLPIKESDFEAPFKIQRDTKNKAGDANAALPSASTCFFSLSLPEYSDKSILKNKLLFAIKNVTTMESDYVTNDAEVGEGWRGL